MLNVLRQFYDYLVFTSQEFLGRLHPLVRVKTSHLVSRDGVGEELQFEEPDVVVLSAQEDLLVRVPGLLYSER